MKILVTGGAGYIGSLLVPQLLKVGHTVTVLDSFSKGETTLVTSCADMNFFPIQGDARDERMLDEVVPKADAIIPLAALVGAPLCARDAVGAVSLNRDAVLAILKRLGKGQKLIYPTTNSGYGVGEKDAFCTEESPLKPVSLYGRTKVEAEQAILDKGAGATVRLATVFGLAPAMRLDLLVNDFTWRAVTDRAVVIFEGHFRRNFIHIRDVVKAFTHVLDHYDSMVGQAYNVGLSTANLSKLQLCERIKSQISGFVYLEAPVGEDPDKRDYVVSNAKIEATGYRPDWTLDAGIAELIKGYRMIRNSRYSNV